MTVGDAVGSEVTDVIADVVAEVLGLDAVASDDNLFALGMSSLTGIRIIARIAEIFDAELDVTAAFATPTVDGLAAQVRLRAWAAAADRVPLVRGPDDAPIVLSRTQRRLWSEMATGRDLQPNVLRGFRITGPLDTDALGEAFRTVVDRHEPLRTAYATSGGEPIGVLQDTPEFVGELYEFPPGRSKTDVDKAVVELVRTPFDLENGPFHRFAVLRSSAYEHVVLLLLAELVADGWSADVLVREISEVYNAVVAGRAPALADIDVRYSDVARWEDLVVGDAAERDLVDYWRTRLTDAPLALGFPLTTTPAAPDPRAVRSTVPPAVAERVAGVCFDYQVTPFAFFFAAYAAVLARYTGGDDLVVWSQVANRVRLATEPLIGLFAANVPLRVRIPTEGTFGELVTTAAATAVDAIRHGAAPLPAISEKLVGDRPFGVPGGFLPRFRLEPPAERLRLDGVRIELYEPWSPVESLALWVMDGPDGYTYDLHYDASTIPPPLARELLDRVERVVAAASAEPEIPLADLAAATDRDLAVVTRSAQRATVPVSRLVEQAAAGAARATAVRDAAGSTSYGDLTAAANRLARLLRRRGIGRGSVVAVDVEPSAALVVALLGVLAAGAAFALPGATATARITNGAAPGEAGDVDLTGDADAVAAEEGTPLAEDPPGLDDVAYVAAVPVTHATFAASVAAQRKVLRLAPRDVVSAPRDADWALTPWAALVAGATVAVPGPDGRAPSGVTVAVVRPEADDDVPRSVRLLVTPGPPPAGKPRPPVVGWYRRAEAGGVAAYAETAAAGWVPLGDVRLEVRDAGGQVLPRGGAGELVLICGGREVPTGDLARVRPDGTVQFAGPLAAHVDVRGILVDPAAVAAVERALAEHPAVADAALGTAPGGPGAFGEVLAAYVVPRAGAELEYGDLDRWLADREVLPWPAAMRQVAEVPRRPDGYPDRASLRALGGTLVGPVPGAPGRTPLEQRLVAACAEVLGHDRTGIDDDFFQAGGDLQAAHRLAARLRAEGVPFDPRMLLWGRTLARAARAVQAAVGS